MDSPYANLLATAQAEQRLQSKIASALATLHRELCSAGFRFPPHLALANATDIQNVIVSKLTPDYISLVSAALSNPLASYGPFGIWSQSVDCLSQAVDRDTAAVAAVAVAVAVVAPTTTSSTTGSVLPALAALAFLLWLPTIQQAFGIYTSVHRYLFLSVLTRTCASPAVALEMLQRIEATAATTLPSAAAGICSMNLMDKSETGSNARDTATKNRGLKLAAAAVVGGAALIVTGGIAAPLVHAGLMGVTAATSVSASVMAGTAFAAGAGVGYWKAETTMQRRFSKIAAGIKDFDLPISAAGCEGSAHVTCFAMGLGLSPFPRYSNSSSRDGGDRSDSSGDGNRNSSDRERWLQQTASAFNDALVASTGERFSEVHFCGWDYSILSETTAAVTAFETLSPNVLQDSDSSSIDKSSSTAIADHPFLVAAVRSTKAGLLLADHICAGYFGRRPISLVGVSFGARVVFSCLEELARRVDDLRDKDERSLLASTVASSIDNVVLIGACVTTDPDRWKRVRRMVKNRIVNVFSRKDLLLRLVIRLVEVSEVGLKSAASAAKEQFLSRQASSSSELLWMLRAHSIAADGVQCARDVVGATVAGCDPVVCEWTDAAAVGEGAASANAGAILENYDGSDVIPRHLYYTSPVVLRHLLQQCNYSSPTSAASPYPKDAAVSATAMVESTCTVEKLPQRVMEQQVAPFCAAIAEKFGGRRVGGSAAVQPTSLSPYDHDLATPI